MPPQSRSQRKRQAARQQTRPPAPRTASTPAPISAPSIGETVPLDPATVAPPMSAPPASAPRAARPNRRVLTRPAPEPVDYTADYAAARMDLRWIAIWAGLLFIAMFALYFSGVV
jgi:hypothetical protein